MVSYILHRVRILFLFATFQEGEYQLTEEQHHQDDEAGHGFWETSPGKQ